MPNIKKGKRARRNNLKKAREVKPDQKKRKAEDKGVSNPIKKLKDDVPSASDGFTPRHYKAVTEGLKGALERLPPKSPAGQLIRGVIAQHCVDNDVPVALVEEILGRDERTLRRNRKTAADEGWIKANVQKAISPTVTRSDATIERHRHVYDWLMQWYSPTSCSRGAIKLPKF